MRPSWTKGCLALSSPVGLPKQQILKGQAHSAGLRWSPATSSLPFNKDLYMDFLGLFEKYWPFLALVLWFSYKWWNSKRVIALLPELRKSGAVFVDVRSAEEFANGNAPGTINIPLQELGSRLGEIPKSTPVVLCCASGTRSGMAKLMLRKKGYRNVHNVGTWSKLLG